MAYRFHNQKPGDMLELPTGQRIIKTDSKQALCLSGDNVGSLLDILFTADVHRIADREDVVSAVLDAC